MNQIHRFKDLPDWEEARKTLQELGLDEKAIADVGEQEGDSLDLVETCMALEEALGSSLSKRHIS
jgi:acyl carrier protein